MSEWNKIYRSARPLTSTVEVDNLTRDLVRPFDYSTDGSESFYPFVLPAELPKDFGIGVIVGASGTGKSTLLSQFGKYVKPQWDYSSSIASHFNDAEDASERLAAAPSSTQRRMLLRHAVSG